MVNDCLLQDDSTAGHFSSKSGSSSSARNRDEPNVGKYRLIKTIGKGNFAKVKLAKHLPTGREVCRFTTDIDAIVIKCCSDFIALTYCRIF